MSFPLAAYPPWRRTARPIPDVLAAYRATSPLFVMDAAKASAFDLTAGTISTARNALGGSATLTGSGFTIDSSDGYAALVLSNANATQALSTTSAGPSSGAAHAIHMVAKIVSVPNDLGTLALIGRQNAAASVLGFRDTGKSWWGSFSIGLQAESSVLAVPGLYTLGLTYSGGQIATLWIDGIADIATSAVADTWSQGFGHTTGSLSFKPPNARIRRSSFWSTSLTKADMNALVRADVISFPDLAQPSVLRTQGDSITAGFGLNPGEDWPTVAITAINAGRYEAATLQNVGVSGSKAFENTAMTSAIALYMPRAKSSVCSIAWMSNDIYISARSSAQVIADLQTCIANARAGGHLPVIATGLCRGAIGATGDATRIAVNTWVRNSSGCHVLDFDSLPHAADPESVVYYQDTTHPTATLAAEMGALAATVIGPLLV